MKAHEEWYCVWALCSDFTLWHPTTAEYFCMVVLHTLFFSFSHQTNDSKDVWPTAFTSKICRRSKREVFSWSGSDKGGCLFRAADGFSVRVSKLETIRTGGKESVLASVHHTGYQATVAVREAGAHTWHCVFLCRTCCLWLLLKWCMLQGSATRRPQRCCSASAELLHRQSPRFVHVARFKGRSDWLTLSLRHWCPCSLLKKRFIILLTLWSFCFVQLRICL